MGLLNFITCGRSDRKKAKSLLEEAESYQNDAIETFEMLKDKVGADIEAFGKFKLESIVEVFKPVAESFKKIKPNLNTKIKISENEYIEISGFSKIESNYSGYEKLNNELLDGAKGLIGGGVAAAGVYTAVGAFGTASTGTAIATLTGVAAQNATLASIGGGALAIGGGGMVAGTAMLGGIVALPFALVPMYKGAKEGRRQLEQAKETASEIELMTEKIEGVNQNLSQIRSIVGLLDKTTRRLLELLLSLQKDLDDIALNIPKMKWYYLFLPWLKPKIKFSSDEKNIITNAYNILNLSYLLFEKVAVLNKDGSPNIDALEGLEAVKGEIGVRKQMKNIDFQKALSQVE